MLNKVDLIIIGAGLSGLMAAQALQGSNQRITPAR